MKRVVKYIADDGTEFSDPAKCQDYERLQRIRKAVEHSTDRIFEQVKKLSRKYYGK